MRRPVLVLLLFAAVATSVRARGGPPVPERGIAMVAADHVLASRAGAEILERGGNAVDAAVAAALAAGVVQPTGSGLGGGGFAVVLRDGRTASYDFREVAPSGASRGMFLDEQGAVDPEASRVGGLAVAVPGEPRGLACLLAEQGTMTPADVAAPAIRLASEGFRVGDVLSRGLERTKHTEVLALFCPGGACPTTGTEIRRPELARTLQDWATTSGENLYASPSADEIAAAVEKTGGNLTAADLAAYRPLRRDPLVGTYKGRTIVTMAPPSSGGALLIQMLGVLEDRDLASMGRDSPETVHLLVETMKHAYADRAAWFGDPGFTEVPVERLISQERIRAVRKAFDPARTLPSDRYGLPFEPPRDGGTSHISAIDATGGAVALTTTINTSFGSGVVVEGLGIVLNDEMDDFAAAPGAPNAYGLVGSEANAIAPGKRPLSSMTPTLVLDGEGQVLLSIGASGGATILSSVLLVLLDVLEFGMDPQEAVAAPRFHHQWEPDRIVLEKGLPEGLQGALEERGHRVVVEEGYSSVQIVAVGEGTLVGGADPRKGGWPAGVSGEGIRPGAGR